MRVSARWAGSAVTLGLLLGAAGCGDDAGGDGAKEVTMDVEDSRREVDARVKEAAQVVSAAGFSLPAATGTWYGCGMEETAGVEYVAGGTVEGSADPVAKVGALRDAFEAEGWSLESAGDTPRPYAILTQGSLRLSVLEDRREPGRISLSVKGECVRGGEETDLSLVNKERRILPD